METKKTKSIILATIIIVIFIVIAILICMYFFADVFKSNKVKFFEYGLSVVEFEGYDGTIQNLENYFKKQESIPFESKSKYCTNIEDKNESMISANEQKAVNNTTINLLGKVDLQNKLVEELINIDYTEEVNFPINVIMTSDLLGFQTKYIGTKYITTNNNLEELIKNESEVDTEKIKVKLEELTTLLKEHAKKYMNAIMDTFDDDRFEKVKDNDLIGYKARMTEYDLKNILIALSQTLKEDQEMINKINEVIEIYYDGEGQDEEITIEDIDEYIAELQEDINDNDDDSTYNSNDLYEEETENIEYIDVTVYVEHGNLSKIVVENVENKFEIQKNENGISVTNESFSLEIQKEFTANIANFKITVAGQNEGASGSLYIKVSFDGIEIANNVSENYEIGYSIIGNGEEIQYIHTLDRNVSFVDNIQIEDLTEENTINLDNVEEEQKENFLSLVEERIELVNKKQMEELEVETNPVLHMIPMFDIFYSSTQKMLDAIVSDESTNIGNIKDNISIEMNEALSEYYAESINDDNVNLEEKLIIALENVSNEINKDYENEKSSVSSEVIDNEIHLYYNNNEIVGTVDFETGKIEWTE